MSKNISGRSLRTGLGLRGGRRRPGRLLLTGGFWATGVHDARGRARGRLRGRPLGAGRGPGARGTGYADLVAKVAPSIVTVRSERKVQAAALPFGERRRCRPSSGASARARTTCSRTARAASARASIVSADGYLLTNHHVVRTRRR